MYHLPKFNKLVFVLIILFIAIFIYFQDFSKPQINPPTMNVVKEINYVSQNSYEQAIIDAVASASPSVVSIVISKNVPVYEQQFINPFGDSPANGLGSPFFFQIPQQ